MLCGITPGPREVPNDDLQHFMGIFAEDLKILHRDGILIKTVRSPQGRLTKVALVVACCDHPAMCKVGGFTDHSTKTWFCTKCCTFHTALLTEDAFCCEGKYSDVFPRRLSHSLIYCSGFQPRDGARHRELAEQCRQIEDPVERNKFALEHGVRWSALLELPYFDPVRMTIIDPMHAIFQGIMKTQWLDGWIRENTLRQNTTLVERELDMIQRYLKNVSSVLNSFTRS